MDAWFPTLPSCSTVCMHDTVLYSSTTGVLALYRPPDLRPEAPLDGAQESYHFDNPTTHTRGAYHQREAA